MEEKWIVSSGGKIGKLSLPDAVWGERAPMERVSALCAGNGCIYCACEDALYSLDAHSLLPRAVFAGAPCIRSLLLSRDGMRLYALCMDADSVLMLSAVTGEAQILCRAGAGPASMMMDEKDASLAVAGGKRPCVLMLCARTLRLRREIAMPGPVCCAAVHGGRVAALCLTDALDTILVLEGSNGVRKTRRFQGFPGALLFADDMLLAAVQGHVHAVSLGELRVLRSFAAPGLAEMMALGDGMVVYLDRLSGTLYALRDGVFSRLAGDVSAFAALGV